MKVDYKSYGKLNSKLFKRRVDIKMMQTKKNKIYSELIKVSPELSFSEENELIIKYLGFNPMKITSDNWLDCYTYLTWIEIFNNEFLKRKWVTLTFWKNGKSLSNRCIKHTYEVMI